MTGRRLVAAAAAAALLLAAVLVLEVLLPRAREARRDARSRLVPRDASVASVRIVPAPVGGARGPLALARGASGWRVRDEATGREHDADGRALGLLVTALRDARVTHEVEEGDRREGYGLGSGPTLSWTWEATPEAPAGSATLALGDVLPDGRHVHARLERPGEAAPRVVVVTRALLEVARQDLSHYRDKAVWRVDSGAVRRIVVEQPRDPEAGRPEAARMVLVRREPPAVGWAIVEPIEDEANGPRVEGLLSRVAVLEAGGFGVEAPGDDDLRAKGLLPPAVSLALDVDGDGELRLDLGAPGEDGLAWARAHGPGVPDAIVLVRGDVRTDLMAPGAFWRDNRAVRLPRWRLDAVRLHKGTTRPLDVEIAKEPDGSWRLVRPGDAAIGASRAQDFLQALEAVRCGRFEDDLAADPEALDRRHDFAAPGSFRLSAFATLEDGTPLRVDLEGLPIVANRDPYFLVRATDQDSRVQACVVTLKSVDALVEEARELAALAGGPAGSPP